MSIICKINPNPNPTPTDLNSIHIFRRLTENFDGELSLLPLVRDDPLDDL